MPALRIQAGTSRQAPKLYRLYKRLTTIGSGPDNDLVLSDPLISDSHACLQSDEREQVLSCLDQAPEFLVNGKRRRRHRLAPGDVVRLGDTELCYLSDEDAQPQAATSPDTPDPRSRGALRSYERLHQFSERLLHSSDLPALLEALLDAIVDITRAHKGFLVLCEGDEMKVQVARNLRHETLLDPAGHISDSILEKVARTRAPVIVSDALGDREFQNSLSVVNLRLSSVMCVPLLERGQLLGVIYVGNDSVKDLFVESDLEVLTIFAAQASLLIRNAILVRELRADKQVLTEELERMRYGSIIGSCAAMQEVFRKVTKVATTDISVLITGETGTGKELIAQEIHRRSPRAKGPLVTINCGAIPEHLLESELFGHVKGAFTGAVQNKPGRFQTASGGTVFLDEIGEMPLPLQVKLLRVLQERMVLRVGDTRPEPVDIRVLAATHRDLLAEIRAVRFREDLFYRLNVVQLHLPPLRERGDDILLIAKYLLSRFCKELGTAAKTFSPSTGVAIRKYPWPGNIRQLENHIKKAIVLSDHALLTPQDLGLSEDMLPKILPLHEAKERFQRDYINEVLSRNNGNRTKTAKDLQVDPRTIFRHLEKETGDGGPTDDEGTQRGPGGEDPDQG